MRAERIKLGFHRIGLVLAGASLLVFMHAVFTAPSSLDLSGRDNDSWMLGWWVATLATYPAARALGWIVEAFASDGDTKSG
jgi:hypothetical protein